MTTPEQPDVGAAEFALGVLEGDERAEAMRRMLADPAFAREVQRWRDQFGALFADWPEADSGAQRPRLAGFTHSSSAGGTFGWRVATAVTGVAAAVLLALLLLRPGPQPAARQTAPTPTLVAVLTPKFGPAFSAIVDRTTREVRLQGAVAVPGGRAAELWTIGADGVPHAAGLLTARPGERVVLARGPAIEAGTTLAISIEPLGGSPGPAPTGPVVATGILVSI